MFARENTDGRPHASHGRRLPSFARSAAVADRELMYPGGADPGLPRLPLGFPKTEAPWKRFLLQGR